MIIIDDLGYNLRHGMKVAQLPVPVTMAIVPFSPHAQKLAEAGTRSQKEVIVHSPMASIHDRPIDAGGLHPSMDRPAFQETLLRQLASLPQAQGLNNHMGSLLTQNTTHMDWLMVTLADKGLYFIDSRTTPNSVAYEVAQERSLPTWSRDIFLDNHRDSDHISEQLAKMSRLAQSRGLVVAIGHPYPETLAALRDFVASDDAQDLIFVTPSQMISHRQIAKKPTQAEQP
jgi:polysaccharide deacetylase 2 family uncharacterized protein YibQ